MNDLDPHTVLLTLGICILVVTALFAACCVWRP
jgi:hypothetical protein